MISTFAVAALALAAEPTFKADARSLFDGCRAKADGANSRLYSCRGWGAGVAYSFSQVAFDSKQAQDLVRAGMSAILPGEANERVLPTQKLGGRTVDVLRLTPKGDAKWAFGDGAVVEVAPGRQRIAFCSAGKLDEASTKQCGDVLAYLIDVGTPDGVDIGSPTFSQEPVLLGRKLKVPTGCKAEIAGQGIGRILCDDSLVTWTIIPDDADAAKRADDAANEIARVQGLSLAKERQSCLIEGEPGQCLKLSGAHSHYVGARAAGTSTLIVTCGSREPNDPFRPVCNGALSLAKPQRKAP